MRWLAKLAGTSLGRKQLRRQFQQGTHQPVHAFGLSFLNPVGLAAGFDKNAAFLNELELLGFGSVEIGTVTPQPQEGNPKPRLFRLVNDKALLNRMGFNNDGKDEIAERLKDWRAANAASRLIIGGNIGKNKSTPNEYAYMDYDACFRALHAYVDYFVVNVSSPNTPGLRELQEKESLRKILTHLQQVNLQMPVQRPILLKIAPDLEPAQVDDVCSLAAEIKLDGLIVANTTLKRNMLSDLGKVKAGEAGDGGISGKPLLPISLQVLRQVRMRLPITPIIYSGGIFEAEDATAAMAAGANLVQVYTGFVYGGPGIVKKLLPGTAAITA